MKESTRNKLVEMGFGLDLMKFEAFQDHKLQLTLKELVRIVEYDELKDRVIDKTKVYTIEGIIKAYGLTIRSRKRYLVYNRILLSQYMRLTMRLTLQEIADMLNIEKHHIILHYMKQYESLKNDSQFKLLTHEMSEDILNLKKI